MDFELRHCRHAVMLAENGTFERAAKALDLTQPSLSRSVQELERRMGTRLFQRTRHGVQPTDAGRIFLERARAVLLQAAEMRREVDLLRGIEKGEVRIGAGVYPAELFVQDAMIQMIRNHPSVRLTVCTNVVDVLIGQLRNRELDLMVGDAKIAQGQKDLHVTELSWHTGHLVVRVGHPLLSLKSPTLGQALSYPLTFPTRVGPDLLAALARAKDGPPSSGQPMPAICCDSLVMMRTIVAATDAIAILPMKTILDEVKTRRLATLPIQPPWLGRTFGIIRLNDRTLSPSAEAMIGYLKSADAAAAALDIGSRKGRKQKH